jgi:hypothetical protein
MGIGCMSIILLFLIVVKLTFLLFYTQYRRQKYPCPMYTDLPPIYHLIHSMLDPFFFYKTYLSTPLSDIFVWFYFWVCWASYSLYEHLEHISSWQLCDRVEFCSFVTSAKQYYIAYLTYLMLKLILLQNLFTGIK